MPFFRTITHLLPRSQAFRLPLGSNIRKLFEGFAGWPFDVREQSDSVYDDLQPSTTTEHRSLEEFELQFGLSGTGTLDDRRKALDSAWKQTGGQDPAYLQARLQDAGFPVYVHEWWQKGVAPFVQVHCGDPLAQAGEVRAQCSDRSFRRFVRNPFDYIEQPLVGTIQCGNPAGVADVIPAQCGEPMAMANRFLANETHYLVNLTLSSDAPPPMPTNEKYWRYVFYVGGANFGSWVSIPNARELEFQTLLLKLRPTQQWIVTLVTYDS